MEFMDYVRRWLGVFLILLGLVRAGLVVLHDPVAGYANQQDMHYTSACLGLYPAKEGASAGTTADAPLSTYSLGARRDGCYQSTEVGIGAVAVALARATGASSERIQLHWVGWVKLALLFITAFLVGWMLRDFPVAGATHGVVVLLILADPVVTLWMNTLYTEFAAIWGVYMIVAAATVLALYDRMSLLAWGLLVVGIIVLAFSREQFALLPLILVLAAWPWLWHASQRLTAAVIVIALIVSAASLWAIPRPHEVQKAARVNAYLGALVPASSSPTRGAEIVRLPEGCVALAGATWPERRAEVEKGCPQVLSLSRFAFMNYLLDEPRALAVAARRAFATVHGVAPPKLGTMSEKPGTAIDDMPWWGFSPLRILDSIIPPLPAAKATAAVFVIAPLALIALLVLRRWRGDPLTPFLLAILLGATALYAYLTTVFGAGPARLDVVGSLAVYSLLLLTIAGLPILALRYKQTPRELLLEGGVGLVAIALGVWLVYLATTTI